MVVCFVCWAGRHAKKKVFLELGCRIEDIFIVLESGMGTRWGEEISLTQIAIQAAETHSQIRKSSSTRVKAGSADLNLRNGNHSLPRLREKTCLIRFYLF